MFRFVLISLLLAAGPSILAANPPQGPPDELIQYVRDARKAGLKAEQIQKNAVNAGWAPAMVQQAIDSAAGAPKAQKSEPVEKSETPVTSKSAPEVTAPNPAIPSNAGEVVKPGAAEPVPARSGVEKSDTAAPATPPVVPSTGGPIDVRAAKPAPIDRTLRDEYRIGEGDVLQISVWGEPAASVPSGVVRPDGMISMPLIKDVRVAGSTPAEVEKVVTEALSKQIKGADVTVIVSQINSKKIFVVGGGVKKEGPISYTYRMTVMQALSEAGGLTDYAKRKKIYVLRDENGRQYKLAFNYDAVLNGEHMELNIPLLPGDTLVVPNH